MLPKCKIIISKGGSHEIIGLEQSDKCYKLTGIAKTAGKIEEEKDIDHSSVHQNVVRK